MLLLTNKDWYNLSKYQKLSEDFIREFQDKVDWINISISQKLSEDFIREFQDKVYWGCISKYQKLSEDFIREFQDKVDWYNISEYQKFSEDFIREFQNKVNWDCISKYQKLSEDFIREFQDKVILLKDNWLYKSTEVKLQYIRDNTSYQLVDDDQAIIAYKAVQSDGHSLFNFQYKYDVNNWYESHCDMNLCNENSFGLSAWTESGAKDYLNNRPGKILQVKIMIKDIGAIVHGNDKIRCQRMLILSSV